MKKIIALLLLTLLVIALLVFLSHKKESPAVVTKNSPPEITKTKNAINEITAEDSSIKCAASNTMQGAKFPEGTEYYCVNKEGIKDGAYMSWYGSGQLMQHLHYKKGKEHGKQQAWWPNGKMMMDGISMEGIRYEGFKYWDIFGRPSSIEFSDKQETNPDALATPSNATN